MAAHSDTPSRGPGSGKRERILAAAEQVFAARGFFQARVSEIAKAAGVADGTIYLYFKSKDDLLISLFEDRMELVNSQLNTALEGATDAPDKLRRFIRAYCELASRHPNTAEVITIELRQSSKFMKEYSNPRFADFLRLLASIIEEGQQAGSLHSEIPAPIAARSLFGALDELLLAWVLGGGEKFDIVRAADWVGDMILSGLEARRTP